MTKETSSGYIPFSIFYRYPRLMQGLSFMSGLGVLSSGLVVAQTDSLVDTGTAPPPPSAPAAVAPAPAPAPAPAARAQPAAPVVRPRPAAPETIVVPETRRSRPAPAPAAIKPAVPAPPPTAAIPRKPALSAPSLSAPDPVSVAKPPKVILNPSQSQDTAKVPVAPGGNSYIDRTDYSVGATPRYNRPAVVVTERSTGCSTVAQNGQISRAGCGTGVASSQPRQRTSTSTSTSNLAAAVTAPLAGLRQPQLNGMARLPLPSPSVVSVAPVRMGPLKVSPGRIIPARQVRYPAAFTRPAASSQSVTPSGLAYYNLTTRPTRSPKIGNASFMFPLTIPSAITSVFGWRMHPITGDHRFHAGTDLGAPQGTPVIAAAPGEVSTADFLGGYGLTVILLHEKQTQASLYAHLSEIFVQPGDVVEQGAVIGRVGSTGNSTGPHLHFEWRHLTSDGWVAVDAGAHLEYALAEFVRALQIAQQAPQRGV